MSCDSSQAHTLSTQPPTAPADVPFGALAPFLILTFGLAWGFLALLVVMPPALERLFGPPSGSHPLFLLAVWTPALVALPLVRRTAGGGALRRYFSRLLAWRAPAGWYAFLLLGIPALFFAGAALAGRGPGELQYPGGAALVQAMGLMMVLGPVEEFGWRGLALPLLQRRMAPLWAGALLGLVWSVWHLPAFFLSGTPQSGWEFMPFFLGTTAVSVILTPLFNSARGSILLAGAFHYQLINPLWPDAQPYDMYLFAAMASVVVWVQRDTMFDRRAGFTEVAPPTGRGGIAADSEDEIRGSLGGAPDAQIAPRDQACDPYAGRAAGLPPGESDGNSEEGEYEHARDRDGQAGDRGRPAEAEPRLLIRWLTLDAAMCDSGLRHVDLPEFHGHADHRQGRRVTLQKGSVSQ